jgi:hypothetical protein
MTGVCSPFQRIQSRALVRNLVIALIHIIKDRMSFVCVLLRHPVKKYKEIFP